MSFTVGQHSFGEANVQFMLVDRSVPQHRVRRFKVDITFKGAFEPVYAEGDNATLLPSSAVNNTTLAFAQKYLAAEPELLATKLAERFLFACPAAAVVDVQMAVDNHAPVELAAEAQRHGFVPSQEWRTTSVRAARGSELALASGVKDLELFLTTGSMFKDFLRDEYTTTPQFDDRALGMKVDVQWFYTAGSGVDFADCRRRARTAVLRTFATHTSRSSEHTCYVLGEAVLQACPEVARVLTSGVHQTRRLADMSAYGYDNPSQIYLIDDAQATTVMAEVIRDGAQ